ncbi:pre-mRNA-processing factor 40 [Fistulifera solaris]|uniref:Pre-mRNA-processing factor 40 n=1 Tax=Fistulifera solaris TaxID=1519565 RepID=A0A1Z5JKB4_FISSO|nr:pre-mRNA-processing factor 40 [Fistulifera solaris]|eukprot:GAX14447.1 pre-mRNA-processing factor 40 [Fistulifera solaris]
MPGPARSQGRSNNSAGRGPSQPYFDRREPRRGGPGNYLGMPADPGWRGHPGPGRFLEHRPPGPIHVRGMPIPRPGPPPPPPRQSIPPPPPPIFARAAPRESFVHLGRGRSPPMTRPPIHRGARHGPGFSLHPPRPPLIPPPPPLPQAYPTPSQSNPVFPTIPPPLTGYILQPSIPPVHPPVHTSTNTVNNNNNTSVWSEFTSPAGVKYYYNSVTKESTYEKPAGFVSPQLRSTAPQPATTNASEWKEYTDNATGKKYYSDGVTTTWEKPVTFTNSTLHLSTDKASSSSSSSDPPNKRLKVSARPKSEFESKEEAVAAFKGFLIAKDVSPTTKWSELTKLYSSDPRWMICEDALATGERKQALAEYQTKRANELRQMERQEKIRAREAFMELLTDSLTKLKALSSWKTSFADIRDSLTRDDRFHAVADESTRESLFLDFCEEIRKREERKKRDLRRQAKEDFIAFLSEKQEGGYLSFASTWNSFVASLDENDKNDERFGESIHMSDSDREMYFADFVHDLRESEEDKRWRRRDAKRRSGEVERDAYEDFLCRLARDDEKLFPWSEWRDIEDTVNVDSSYKALYELDSDAPKELFEDFVSDWNHRYRKDQEVLAELLRPSSHTKVVVDCETSFDTFKKGILEAAQRSPGLLDEITDIFNQVEPVSSAKVFLKEMQSKNGTGRSVIRRTGALRIGHYDSSEDEGEITEEIEK